MRLCHVCHQHPRCFGEGGPIIGIWRTVVCVLGQRVLFVSTHMTLTSTLEDLDMKVWQPEGISVLVTPMGTSAAR